MALHPSPDVPPAAAAGTAPRRTRVLTLLALACALAALLWAGRGQFDSYRAWWSGPAGADLVDPYRALSPAMDEAALQRHFAGAALRCNDVEGGERLCTAPLSHVDGVPAARLQATLADGRLRAVEVWVPWWEHHSAARRLTADLGAPAFATTGAEGAGPASIGWELPGGRVHIARHPGWNPWRWTRLHWTARAPL